MRSSASIEEKQKIAESFVDTDYNDFKKEAHNVTTAIEKIVNMDDYLKIVNKDEQVLTAFHSYLYALEEAEYMYPHAKRAVTLFLLEYGPSNEK
jgi:hypothetical protein